MSGVRVGLQFLFMNQSIRFNLLLLLLCLVYHSGTATILLTGKKGNSITLSCDFEDREISDISLFSLSENIPVCQEKNCSGRVFKEGSCDIIIKDLIFSDAGKYFLNIYYYNDQREVKRRILEYHLHIHDEISVKTGEQLKMDVLLINADKVEKNSSGEWTEVWTRGHGVSSDRLTDRDGNLTISNFTVTDTGTYRVLDSEGEILITVTVTESKGKLDTDDDKPNGSEQHTLESWIIVVSVIGALLVLVISALIWKYKCQHSNTEHEPVPMDPSDMLNNINGNSQSAFRDNRSTQDSINGFSCSLYLQERHSGPVGNTEEPLPALIKPNPMTK